MRHYFPCLRTLTHFQRLSDVPTVYKRLFANVTALVHDVELSTEARRLFDVLVVHNALNSLLQIIIDISIKLRNLYAKSMPRELQL